MEHEYDGIVVLDCAAQHSLGVIGIRRDHHFQPRQMAECCVQALRVLTAVAVASAHRRHQHHRAHHLTAREETLLGGEAVDRIHAYPEEIDEHELYHGPQTNGRHHDRHTDEALFRCRRVATHTRPDSGQPPTEPRHHHP